MGEARTRRRAVGHDHGGVEPVAPAARIVVQAAKAAVQGHRPAVERDGRVGAHLDAGGRMARQAAAAAGGLRHEQAIARLGRLRRGDRPAGDGDEARIGPVGRAVDERGPGQERRGWERRGHFTSLRPTSRSRRSAAAATQLPASATAKAAHPFATAPAVSLSKPACTQVATG